MKINQVEQQAGITKGNIRFYEKEGLLTPGRNSENGYREYDQADVVWLKKIRLLRMLDVPIDEILQLKNGRLTLEEAMARHREHLARRQRDLTAMEGLCAAIQDSRCPLEGLDADGLLAQMERQEQEGTRFMNVKRQDKITRYMPPVAAALVILALIGALVALLVWGLGRQAPPMGVIIGLGVVLGAVIVGVLLAMVQRLKQIRGGEEDAASQY